jgi:hypothetical protein
MTQINSRQDSKAHQMHQFFRSYPVGYSPALDIFTLSFAHPLTNINTQG